jgi:1,4-dihydroxy-6-naphthoate synthase
MRITIAHSPDSDDAFMFYGLASGKVPTGDLEVVHVLSDIETLNRAGVRGQVRDFGGLVPRLRAPDGQVHPAAARRQHGRQLRPDGVVRRDGPTSLDGVTVAIPGTLTTAFLALRLYKPDVQYVVMPFDEISKPCATARSRRGC